MAESGGEGLIENKVLVTAAWAGPPIPPSPLVPSTSLYLIVRTFVSESINYSVSISQVVFQDLSLLFPPSGL